MNDLKQTPLNELHLKYDARMAPFAGYSLPIQYAMGVKKEHLHTRSQAGLFDVSHMGQLKLTGPDPAHELEKIVSADVVGLGVGRQRYALFTQADGGILDDLMISNMGDHWVLVVNAACKEQDIQHLRDNLSAEYTLEEKTDSALVALQGPKAAEVLARLCPESANMRFMDSRYLSVAGVDCMVSRSGYTGEDGFEIAIPAAQAEALCQQMLDFDEVELIGLGARDSLRLEAGLCLYGHDLNRTTTPGAGNLHWAIGKARRTGGDRAGGFPGSDKILPEIDNKSYAQFRVGLIIDGKVPVREGTEIADADGNIIGHVTSGTVSPSLEKPIAMAYIKRELAEQGATHFALVRQKQVPVTVSPMPFVTPNYYRG